MSSVDERVVEMRFNNEQFQKGTDDSVRSLGKLKESLNLDESAKGLSNLQGIGDRFSLAGIANSVEGIAGKFTNLGIVGVTALADITSKAVDAGIKIVKSLTIDHISDGFKNYETQINAVQTILSNTQTSGGNLKNVTAALADLNTYANKTVYNFSEMAANIGTFTAAGVKLGPSVAAIKGIANLGAMSGSTSQQVSGAMYQISQALAAGRVKLQDWNSVVNAGMGGKVFQTALINTARAQGVAIDGILKAQGGFRNSMQKGWLTSSIMTKTLAQFTGDLSQKQLEAQGFTAKQSQAIMKQAASANEAATKIKTVTQLTQALGEEVGTAWAAIFKTVVGDINQAKSVLSPLHNVLENDLTNPIYALNNALKEWSLMGGRNTLIDSLLAGYHGILNLVEPIKKAFREIFPPLTGTTLVGLTGTLQLLMYEFQRFTKGIGPDVGRTFKGIFALLDIGIQVVKAIVGMFGDLTSGSGNGAKSILDFTARIGDWLVKLDAAVKSGTGLATFFHDLGAVISVPLKLIENFVGALFAMASGLTAPKQAFSNLTKNIQPLQDVLAIIVATWSLFMSAMKRVWAFFGPVATEMANLIHGIALALISAAKTQNYSEILSTINTALFGGLILMIRNFIKNIGKKSSGMKIGFLDQIHEVFEGITGSLTAMQQKLKSEIILKIAEAVGILAVSAIGLSLVNPRRLAGALGAITAMFAELMTSLTIFTKIVGARGLAMLPVAATGLILLSTSIVVLSGAVAILSRMSWGQLLKGLTGLTVILLEVIGTSKLINSNMKGLISASIGMNLIADAIKNLAKSVGYLGAMKPEQLVKGLASVGLMLGAIVLFSKKMGNPKGLISTGAGLFIISEAMVVLAKAVGAFGKEDWLTLGRGLAAMAAALVIIVIAIKAMPLGILDIGPALYIVGLALQQIAKAMKEFGGMSWEQIGKSMVMLAGSLVILAGAMLIMQEGIIGAAAIVAAGIALAIMVPPLVALGRMGWDQIGKGLTMLGGALLILSLGLVAMTFGIIGAPVLVVAAMALAVLVPVLKSLGSMSWASILTGLGALAGVFIVLGVAGALITPAIPGLLGLAAAIVLIGLGVGLAGAGVLALAIGLTALNVAFATGGLALTAFFTAVLGILPAFFKSVGDGVVEIIKIVGRAAPELVNTIIKIVVSVVNGLANAVKKMAPPVVNAIVTVLDVLAANVPKMVTAGMKLAVGVIRGIGAHIDDLINAGATLVVKFINGISNNMPKILDAGANLVVKFVNSLATTIRKHNKDMQTAGSNLAGAIISGMTGGLSDKVGDVVSTVWDIGRKAVKTMAKALNSHSPSKEFYALGQYATQGFALGLRDGNKTDVNTAYADMKQKLSDMLMNSKQAIDTATQRLSSLESAHKKNVTAIANELKLLHQAQTEHARAGAAYNELTKHLVKQKTELDHLSDSYTIYATKLGVANQKLADAKKTRDDYNSSLVTQYSGLQTIDSGTHIQDYESNMKTQIKQTEEFTTKLQKLRKLGLDDTMYKQLLQNGTAALPFVDQLLGQGKAGVTSLDSLSDQLTAAAKSLGTQASSSLYQAGVDSAQGLVDGLKKKQKEIQKQIDIIADEMVNRIKQKLKIHSPSQEFADVGDLSMDGLALGLKNGTGKATYAAAKAGDAALAQLKKSMSGVATAIASNIDTTPTIRPVLDLSAIQQGAAAMGSMLPNQSLSVATTFASATSAANKRQMSLDLAAENNIAAAKNAGHVTFNQYNNSPKELSAAEIYRQTKNQISIAKGALTK